MYTNPNAQKDIPKFAKQYNMIIVFSEKKPCSQSGGTPVQMHITENHLEARIYLRLYKDHDCLKTKLYIFF